MKLSQVISVVSLGAVVHCSNFFYQPNGVFVPISLGVSANVQQQQQTPQAQVQLQTPQAQAQRPPQEPPARSPWSLGNLFGLGSWFGGNKSSNDLTPAVHDPATTLLAQFLTPMRAVAARFLARVQTQLEKADPKDLAKALRGPFNDLKDYLVSHWPKPETKSLVLPGTPPNIPVPAIRGSIAAEMAR
ncbi:hypothetical protein FBU31_006784, partial [Coemansia sp. 'formosensis']